MLNRLGFPDMRHHRRFVVALFVDALGSGIFMPLSIIYFVATTDLGPAEVGLAMSLAQAIGIPAALGMGSVVDRVGPKRVLLIGNALHAAVFACYPLAESWLSVAALLVGAAMGQAMFWSSLNPFVGLISREGEREKWFGFVGALRNVGFAFGGVLAGIVLSVDAQPVYHGVTLANALSYALTFVLLVGVAAGGRPEPSANASSSGGWGVVLRDRPYRWLVASNTCYATVEMVLNVALPIYFVVTLGLPGWLVGTVFVINTVMVGFGQGLVVQAMTGHRRRHVLWLGWTFSLAAYVGYAAMGAVGATAAIGLALVAALAMTMGEMTNGPILVTVAVESTPVRLRGRYLGLYQLSWNLSGVIAPVTFTWLLEQHSLALWGALGGIVLIGWALIEPMARRLPVAAGTVTNSAT